MSPDEEIVVAGIAGRFPKSANVLEFKNNLYNKVYLHFYAVNDYGYIKITKLEGVQNSSSFVLYILEN